jgi:hypothetical protein
VSGAIRDPSLLERAIYFGVKFLVNINSTLFIINAKSRLEAVWILVILTSLQFV